VSVVCCQVEVSDHSSIGVLPTVLRRFVWSGNLMNEETLTRIGSQERKKEKKKTLDSTGIG